MKRSSTLGSLSKLALAATFTLLLNACSKTDDRDLNPTIAYGKDDTQAQVMDMPAINSPVVLEDRGVTVDYYFTQQVAVNANLTLKPGVTIMFADGAGLTVNANGSLTAIGTPTAKIGFTAKSSKRGSWTGITILSTSAKNVLAYCKVEQGGGSTPNGSANIVVGSANPASVEISNCEITASATDGIVASEGSKLQGFSGNTIHTNTAYPLNIHITLAAGLNKQNTYTNNGKEYIKLSGDSEVITKDITLPQVNEPYLLCGQVEAGAGFTINPGTMLYMDSRAVVAINGANGYFKAQGTASQPVTIIATESKTGSWGRLQFNGSTNANNLLEYCHISGGGEKGDSPANTVGMISVVKQNGTPSSVTIRNCTITNSASCGIYIQSPGNSYNNDILTANTFANNAGGNVYID